MDKRTNRILFWKTDFSMNHHPQKNDSLQLACSFGNTHILTQKKGETINTYPGYIGLTNWVNTGKKLPLRPLRPILGGGFKYVLFSPLFVEDSHFD